MALALGIFWLVIGAIPAALLIMVLVRGLTLPRGLNAGAPSVCGRCRHEIAPVSAQTPMLERCPECGTPYTVGGVLTLALAKKTRPGLVTLILTWTMIAGTVTLIGAGIAQSVSYAANYSSGMQQSFSQSIGAVRSDGGAPTTQPGYSVRFDADLRHQWSSATGGTIALTIRPDAGPSTRAEIDAAAGSWVLPATGAAGDAFDTAAAERALTAAGIDTTTAWARYEADILAGAVEYLRRDPGTAVHDVLGNAGPGATSITTSPTGVLGATVTTTTTVGPSGSSTSVTRSITWAPGHLTATAQSGDSSSALSFAFESNTVDQFHSGSPSLHAYDGSIRVGFLDEGTGPVLGTITISVRPPEGWPVEMVYEPGRAHAAITRAGESSEASPSSHPEAIALLADTAGLTTPSGSPDPGLEDLLDLIVELEVNPTAYDTVSAYGASGGGSAIAATPPGDGNPDGGFVTVAPASNQFNYAPSGAMVPIPMIVVLGIGILLWMVGIVLIVLRRFSLYPEAVVVTGNPASSAS